MAQLSYDSTIFDPKIAEFIIKFYSYADSKDTIESWSACFAEDVVMVRAEGNVVGRKSLVSLNQKTWEGLTSRKHSVLRGFAFGPRDIDEVMVYGFNEYVYDDKSTGRRDWASRIKLGRQKCGGFLITEYQSYLSPIVKE